MSPSEEPSRPIPLADIAAVFTRIGLASFGGGLVSWIYREAVERRRWMTDHEFLSGLAVCQILPGANIVNFSVYLGVSLRGLLGALSAFGGLVLPPALLAVVIYQMYTHLHDLSAAQFILDGVAAVAVGLNIATAIKAARRSGNALSMTMSAAVFVAVGVLHWSMIWVVLGAAPLSLALAWRNERYG